MEQYEKELVRVYHEMYLTSSATVLQPPRIALKKPKVRAPPEPKIPKVTGIDELMKPWVETMEKGRDALQKHLTQELRKKGIRLDKGAVGERIQRGVEEIGVGVSEFMSNTLSLDTLKQLNDQDPPTFLRENMEQLDTVLDKYTQTLDTFLNEALNVGQNIEEDNTLQATQMQELLIQALLPILAEQTGVVIQQQEEEKEQPRMPSAIRSVKGAVRREKIPSKPSPTISKPEGRSTKQVIKGLAEKVGTLTVPLYQISLWSFRHVPLVVSGVGQFVSILQNSAGYFQVLVESTDAIKGNELKVRRAKARRALSTLKREGKEISNLQTEQLAQSLTFWNYARRRFQELTSKESLVKLLPGLLAMIVQSSAGHLILVMNNVDWGMKLTGKVREEEQARRSAIERIRDEVERLRQLRTLQEPEQQREFLLTNFVPGFKEATAESNFLWNLENLRRGDPTLAALIHFDAWKILLNDMLKRSVTTPMPFFDAEARNRLILSDDVLSTRNREFYEQNKAELNRLARIYPGWLQSVTTITRGLPCVLPDSICALIDQQLPGASDFLEKNVKLLHSLSNASHVQSVIEDHPDMDLGQESRNAAMQVMLDVPSEALEQVSSLQELAVSRAQEALREGDSAALMSLEQQAPAAVGIAHLKSVGDAIKQATEEYIQDAARPIPLEELQERATSLNREANWEALGAALIRGSNNTVINNLVLSVLASVSRTLLGFHWSSFLSGSLRFTEQLLPNILQWVPRMASVVAQYGVLNHMISLAVAHGVIGFTNIAEEWDTFMNELAEQQPQPGQGGVFRGMFLGVLKGLRKMSQLSLDLTSYINRNAQVGWLVFAAMMGLQLFSTTVWEGALTPLWLGATGIGAAAFQTAIQSSGILALAGAEGALHALLTRYMTGYLQDREKEIERAQAAGATEEDLAVAQAAQTDLYWSPVRWAMWGSAISVGLNTARLVMGSDSGLWGRLFESPLLEQALDPTTTTRFTPSIENSLGALESELLGSAYYSSRMALAQEVALAVQAAGSR